MRKSIWLSVLFCLALGVAFLANSVRGDDTNQCSALFASKCAMCHGKDGKGTAMWKSKGMVDFTSADYQKSVTDDQIKDAIENGKKPMAGYKGKLSDDDIKALVVQVREFGHH